MNIDKLNQSLSNTKTKAVFKNNAIVITHEAFTITIQDNVESFELSNEMSEISETLPKVLRILNEHLTKQGE